MSYHVNNAETELIGKWIEVWSQAQWIDSRLRHSCWNCCLRAIEMCRLIWDGSEKMIIHPLDAHRLSNYFKEGKKEKTKRTWLGASGCERFLVWRIHNKVSMFDRQSKFCHVRALCFFTSHLPHPKVNSKPFHRICHRATIIATHLPSPHRNAKMPLQDTT